MAESIGQRFVLHDDGAWMYYLDAHGQISGRNEPVVPEADGQPMTPLSAAGWWATDHEASTITVRRPVPAKTTGYRLRDASAASEKFPAELTPDQWANHSAHGDLLWDLYDAVTEQQPEEVITIEGPWVRLDGTPPPDDGHTWVPRLPDALRNRPEYHHLFPGYMPDFRSHIERLARRHPRKDTVLMDFQGVQGIRVTLRVPFDPPVTEYRPARNLNGSVSRSRRGKDVLVTAQRKLVLDVPARITGATRAEAAAQWDEQTAYYQALLDGASVAACSHCRGRGYVEADEPEDEA